MIDSAANLLGAAPGMLPTSATSESKTHGAVNSAEKMEGVGQEFEAVFLSMMIKEMRKSIEGDGFFSGDSGDTYGGLFDMFIGKHLAQVKPLGISEIMLEQYNKTNASQQQEASGAESKIDSSA